MKYIGITREAGKWLVWEHTETPKQTALLSPTWTRRLQEQKRTHVDIKDTQNGKTRREVRFVPTVVGHEELRGESLKQALARAFAWLRREIAAQMKDERVELNHKRAS